MTKKIVSEHVGAWSRYTLLLLATSCLLAAGYPLLSGLVAFFLLARCRVRDSSENPTRNAWFPCETRGSLAKRVVHACFACVRNGVAWIAADSPARGFGRERTYFFSYTYKGKQLTTLLSLNTNEICTPQVVLPTNLYEYIFFLLKKASSSFVISTLWGHVIGKNVEAFSFLPQAFVLWWRILIRASHTPCLFGGLVISSTRCSSSWNKWIPTYLPLRNSPCMIWSIIKGNWYAKSSIGCVGKMSLELASGNCVIDWNEMAANIFMNSR